MRHTDLVRIEFLEIAGLEREVFNRCVMRCIPFSSELRGINGSDMTYSIGYTSKACFANVVSYCNSTGSFNPSP
jgi:hypothetical protein